MLAIDIREPSSSAPPTDPIVLAVLCEHGSTTSFWSRVCLNGCHADPVRRLSCAKLRPSARVLRRAAIERHGALYRCDCTAAFWMREGPPHRVPADGLRLRLGAPTLLDHGADRAVREIRPEALVAIVAAHQPPGVG